jgi:hypothetical protein
LFGTRQDSQRRAVTALADNYEMETQQPANETSAWPALGAFAGGLALIFLLLALFLVLRPSPMEPCFDPAAASCRTPGADQSSMMRSWQGCEMDGKRVCLVTLGKVPAGLVEHLREHFRREYGLEVRLGPALVMSEAVLETSREAREATHVQVDGRRIAEYVAALRLEQEDPNWMLHGMTMIVVTGADLYLPNQPSWRYAFGTMRDFANHTSGETAGIGVISYFRMDDRVYGLGSNDRALKTRRKMVTKYIGVMHYGLPTTPDPESVLFNSILGVDDLDHMSERLPLRR